MGRPVGVRIPPSAPRYTQYINHLKKSRDGCTYVPPVTQLCYDGLMSTANTVLDELLEPVGACFTPEVAQRLINLRASSAVQKRIEELARKSEQGQLSKVEQEEYEALVSAGNFIAILQSKARRLLKDRPA